MRAAGYEGWGEQLVNHAEEQLEEIVDPLSDKCDLRFLPWKLETLAIAGRHDQAIQYFTQGVSNGWRGNGYFNLERDWQWVAYYNPALYEIRSDPAFQAAVSLIEADVALQRANVRAMLESGEIVPPDEL